MRALALLLLAATLSGCAAFNDDTPPDNDADAAARIYLSTAGYQNPVYPANFPDPFVLEHSGRFYAYATQDREKGFQVMESPDLITWTHRGICLRVPYSTGDLWAPEVVERAGRFYMFFSARSRDSGSHDLAVAIADSPLGPFSPRATLVRSTPGRVGIIDPNIFTDDDGSSWLLYSQESPRAIVLLPLAHDLLSVGPQRTELLHPTQPWEGGVVEAPTLIKRRGIYHLFYSGGAFQARKSSPILYAVGHATSSTLTGPYTKSTRRILESVPGRVYAPGHQCIITVRGIDWLLYHAWDNREEPMYGKNPVGRTLRLDRLEWSGDTPRVDGPSLGSRARPLTTTAY